MKKDKFYSPLFRINGRNRLEKVGDVSYKLFMISVFILSARVLGKAYYEVPLIEYIALCVFYSMVVLFNPIIYLSIREYERMKEDNFKLGVDSLEEFRVKLALLKVVSSYKTGYQKLSEELGKDYPVIKSIVITYEGEPKKRQVI